MSLPGTVAAWLDATFDFAPPPRIGVACSGGGDSMALLHLVALWARGARVGVQVATVDHGLREGARREAEMVADACAAMGLQHHILNWTWSGGGNLQDAARRGRRALISDWAEARNIDNVCLGHTRDDQAETVVMRLMRGSGVDGLAGMRAGFMDQGIYWMRPLLDIPRETLRDWLAGEGIAWAEDPSNEDTRFDRVRARQAIDMLDLDTTRLSRTARQMAAAEAVLHRAARDLADEAVTQQANDLILDRAALRGSLHDTRWRLVAAALQYVGDRIYRPRFNALEDFTEALLAGQSRTLSGVRSCPEGKTTMRLTPEHGAKDTATDRDNFHRWLATH